MVGRALKFIKIMDIRKNLFNLKDKVIIVTGGAGLLGRTYIEAILLYDGTPIVLDVSSRQINKTVNYFREKFDIELDSYTIDITQESQVKEVSEQIFRKYKKIDALINNAAVNPKVEDSEGKNFSRLENFPLNEWMRDISVSLTGSFLCSKYFGTLISANANGGTIINISSDLGLIAPDQRLYRREELSDEDQPVKPVTYSVAKSGIIGLSRYLSTYWPEKKVRSNVICPGGVENGQDIKFISEVSKRIPMGALANKNDYQSAIVCMLSDASYYLNGAVIAIDGGRSAW